MAAMLEESLFEVTAGDRHRLVEDCLRARTHAHCPYSKFPVGATVLATSGDGREKRFVSGQCHYYIIGYVTQ